MLCIATQCIPRERPFTEDFVGDNINSDRLTLFWTITSSRNPALNGVSNNYNNTFMGSYSFAFGPSNYTSTSGYILSIVSIPRFDAGTGPAGDILHGSALKPTITQG